MIRSGMGKKFAVINVEVFLKWPFLFTLLLMTLIGAGLRMAKIDAPIVWHDEVMTLVYVAGTSPKDLIESSLIHDQTDRDQVRVHVRDSARVGSPGATLNLLARKNPHHTPLYYVLAGAVARIGGNTAQTGRRLALFFGVLAIAFAFLLGREVFHSQLSALVFSTFVATSPFHLLYSQEAREYSLWTMLTFATLWFFLRALRERRRSDGIRFSVSLFFLLQSHLLAVLILPALFWTAKSDRRRLFAWILPAIVGWLAWITVFAVQRSVVVNAMDWLGQGSLSLLRWSNAFLDRMEYMFFDFRFAGDDYFLWRVVVQVLLVAVPVLGIYRALKSSRKEVRRMLPNLVLWPLAFVVVGDRVLDLHMALVPRYLTLFFIGYQLLVTLVFSEMFPRGSLGSRIASAFAIVVLGTLGLHSEWKTLQTRSSYAKHFYEEPLLQAAEILAGFENPRIYFESLPDDFEPAYKNLLALTLEAQKPFRLQKIDEKTEPELPSFVWNPSEKLIKAWTDRHYKLVSQLQVNSWKGWSLYQVRR
jgi:uncharacterized membrane protein